MSKDSAKDDRLISELRETFKDTVQRLGVVITRVISDPRLWEGYNDVRDIVDKGQLRASQKISYRGNRYLAKADIQYLSDYAAPVHNGAMVRLKNGAVKIIPKRPFIDIAMEEMDFESKLRSSLNRTIAEFW